MEEIESALATFLQSVTEAPKFGSLQLYASVHGQPIANLAVGVDGAGSPIQTSSLMPWRCATKAATASLTMNLVGDDLIRLDQPVSSVLPTTQMADVTIRDLLQHEVHFAPDPPAGSIARPVGRAAVELAARSVVHNAPGYSEWVGFTLLGGVIEETIGCEVGQAIRDKIFEPLGMWDSWLTMPESRLRDYGDRVPHPGGSDIRARYLASNDLPQHSDRRSAATGGRGPARELGLLYESLVIDSADHRTSALRTELLEYWDHPPARPQQGPNRTVGGHWPLPVPRWRAGLVVEPRCFGLREGRVAGQSGENGLVFAEFDHQVVVVLLGDRLVDWELNLAMSWHLVELLFHHLGLGQMTARRGGRRRWSRRRADVKQAR